MAEILTVPIDKTDPRPSENLVPNYLTFNKDVPYVGLTNVTGTGVSSMTDANSIFMGSRSLYVSKMTSAAYKANDGGAGLTRVTANESGNYILQFWLRAFGTQPITGDTFLIELAKNGVDGVFEFTVQAEDLPSDGNWHGFFGVFALAASDYIDFTFGLPNAISAQAMLCDGIKVEINNRGLFAPTCYTPPSKNYPSAVGLSDGTYVLQSTGGFTELVAETP